jgi:hypothetical protein
MCVRLRHLPTLWLALGVMAIAAPARAWVETSFKSHVVTIDVERDGRATVGHELFVQVRGGPLRGLELAGIDADAELLPDGSVVPGDSDTPSGKAIPLLLERREDRSLRIEIDHEKGIRRGTYRFAFRYRTNLVERELARAAGALVELRWIGPRLSDGIDSARVVFRLPPAGTPPRLPEASERAQLGIDDEPAGVFLSSLRRAPDKDELEIVRPHVAAGEPVVWRVLVGSKALDAFASPEPVVGLEPPPGELPAPPARRALLLGLLALLALGYGALVLVKFRAATRASAERGATARALIGLPAALRAALSGATLAAAVGVAAATRHPTLAGALLLVSMLLAAHASPRAAARARGPGRWLPLSEEEAFGGRVPKLPGRWLDAGSPLGFALFALALGGFTAAAIALFPRSPYHALLVALGSACLLPLFCTGRGGELPLDPVHGPRRLLGWLTRRLRTDQTLRVVPWARIPDGTREPDELRLLVALRQPVQGLVAVEVGLESQPGIGGPISAPWVIVRALDGSPAHAALAKTVAWTRGRKPEERVSVLRPNLPTRRLTLGLLEELASVLSEQNAPARRTRQPPIKPRSSSGRGSSTAKPAMFSSPGQAM